MILCLQILSAKWAHADAFQASLNSEDATFAAGQANEQAALNAKINSYSNETRKDYTPLVA